MATPPPSKLEVLAKIDAWYLTEYVAFAGQIREYANDTLGQAFKADPNDLRRAHHMVQLVQLEYAAYEDAAALLKALISFRQGSTATVLATLEAYKPGDAVLSTVFEAHRVTSAKDLFGLLRLDGITPLEWAVWFPALDLEKALLHICQFFTIDCRANQKPEGVAAYNKSKHGPLVVSRGDILGLRFAPVPSMFFANKWGGEFAGKPVILYGFPSSDEQIENKERVIHFVQRSLRTLVAALLPAVYPAVTESRWGPPVEMWQNRTFDDILEFIGEITANK